MLVVLASEFSRDMIVEGVPGSNARDQSRAPADVMRQMIHYGLHRHFTGSGSVLIFGGGFRRGLVYGETAPERPLLVTKDPITIPDLHATLLHLLGFDHTRLTYKFQGRQFRLTDVHGQVVEKLLA